MKNFIKRWGEIVVNYRWVVLTLSVLLLAASILPMKNLYFDNSNEMFFLKGDINLVTFDKFLDRFGDSEYLLIGLESRPQDKNVFNEDTLKTIAKITEFLENHEVVTKVSSLTKYQYIKSEDDVLSTIDLIEDMGQLSYDQDSMDHLVSIMNEEELVHGALISKDFRHTVVFARTQYVRGNADHQIKLINELNAFLAKENFEKLGFNIRIFGGPLLAERFLNVTIQDQMLINPLMYSIILCLLFISFRTVTGILMPIMIIAGSLVLTIGLQGFLHWPFNTVNTALPGILTIVGIGDAIHIIVEFYHFRNEGLDPRQAAKKSIEVLWLPCFYTSITTAAGFIALSVTKLAPIRELGILGASGAMLAFLLSVVTLPAILSFIKPLPVATQKIVSEGIIARFTHQLAHFTHQNYKGLIAVGGIGLVAGLGLVSQLDVDTNYVNYFKKNTKLRSDIEYFDQVYQGGSTIEFMIDSGEEGAVKNPAFLNKVLHMQEYLEGLDGTGKANSMINYIRKMNQAMHNDDPTFYTIPETRELIAQYLLLYENTGPEENLMDMRTSDDRYLRLSLRIKNMTALKTHTLVKDIQDYLQQNYPELPAELTGTLMLFNAQDVYTQQGMVRSFGLALTMIGLMFFVLFRSVKYGFLALVPSILPILMAGGLMELLGISLDMGTMIVGAMTMGIAVDDTIHVLNRYLQARKNNRTVETSIHLAMIESGRAVIFSSIILTAGFSVMLLGSFMPFIYMGIFSAIIIMFALIADLFFLPALLYVVDGGRMNSDKKT
ncbi:MAG: MMPL family transporter [SAR324 cluster bacterium]|nr:MMPL family transporter [SAR324 cluster bacterium]